MSTLMKNDILTRLNDVKICYIVCYLVIVIHFSYYAVEKKFLFFVNKEFKIKIFESETHN